MINLTIKPMKLVITKVNESQYTRIIYDLRGNTVWDGGLQFYMFDGQEVMTADRMNELIEQMKQLPSWNIQEVVNDFNPVNTK